MTPEQILALPLEENDSGATTVRGYLIALLETLWEQKESFGGKRPFGNSGWKYDLFKPLIKAGAVTGELYADGYIQTLDERHAEEAIAAAIKALGASPA